MKGFTVGMERNEKLINAINLAKNGTTIRTWCNDVNIAYQSINKVLQKDYSPINKMNGEFYETPLKLMDALGCIPEDLWDNEVLYPLETNFCEFDSIDKDVLKYADEDFVSKCPSEYIEAEQLADMVQEMIESLNTERQKDVIRRRFGIEHDREYLLSEIGEDYGVTRTSIMNTEAKALRMLRHPTRSDTLRLFINPHPIYEISKRVEKPITKPVVFMCSIHASKGERESFERAKGFIEHAMKKDESLDFWPALKQLYYKL